MVFLFDISFFLGKIMISKILIAARSGIPTANYERNYSPC